MSRTLSESLIIEGIKALREQAKGYKTLNDYLSPGDYKGAPSKVYKGKNNNFGYHDIPSLGTRISSTTDFKELPNVYDEVFGMSTDPKYSDSPVGDNFILPPRGSNQQWIQGTGRGSVKGGYEETKRRLSAPRPKSIRPKPTSAGGGGGF